jgi:hypothetical protein
LNLIRKELIGPLNEGIKVRSFYEFQKIFGDFTSYSVLAYAVYGFFDNGGKECVIVRVAHIDKENEVNSVARASLQIHDYNGKHAFSIVARYEGTWGNEIQLRLWHDAVDSVPIMECGDDWIDVDTTEDFSIGDTVSIKNEDSSEYAVIVNISENRIYFKDILKREFDIAKSNVICENIRFNLAVIHNRKVEEHTWLSTNKNDKKYFVDHVNNSSNVIEIIDVKSDLLPLAVQFKNLQSGRNGILGLTPADFIGEFKGFDDNKGLGVFESFPDIRLIAAPDIVVFEELIHNNKQALKDIEAVQRSLVDHCERLGNRFAILDLPNITDTLKLIKWTEKFDSHSAAIYYPRMEVMNPEDATGVTSVIVPNSGHIAGIYAETDHTRGNFHAPANIFIEGAVGLLDSVNDELYEVLYPKGINTLRYIPGRGIKVWGARTLSSDPDWRYINVRRTFVGISNAIRNGAAWAVFEINSPALQKRIVRHVTAFLIDRWREGYFKGTVPDDAFYVCCNEELNPLSTIDEGIITVEVGIAITRPAEFLVMKIKANSTESMITVED